MKYKKLLSFMLITIWFLTMLFSTAFITTSTNAANTGVGDLRIRLQISGDIPVELTKDIVYKITVYQDMDASTPAPDGYLRNHPAVNGGVGTDENGKITVTASGDARTYVTLKNVPAARYMLTISYNDMPQFTHYNGYSHYNHYSEVKPYQLSDNYIYALYTRIKGRTISTSVSGIPWTSQSYSYTIEGKPSSELCPYVYESFTATASSPEYFNDTIPSGGYYTLTAIDDSINNIDIQGYTRTTTYSINGETPITAPTNGNIVLKNQTFTVEPLSIHFNHHYTKIGSIEGPISSQISAGNNFMLALMEDGTVWAWGENQKGQCGVSPSVSVTEPVKIIGLPKIVKISAGMNHSLALSYDGKVWAWGENTYAQLGNNSTITNYIPTQVKINNSIILSDIEDISAGSYHSIAMTKNGDVYSWGLNTSGELGIGSTATQKVATKVPNISGATKVAAGQRTSFVIAGSQNTVYACGRNDNGQLGNGSFDNVNILKPVLIEYNKSLTGVQSISSVYAHSIALASNGTVWVWGHNNRSQLGNNGTDTGVYATQIMNGSNPLTDIVSVAAGYYHSLAVGKDGGIWAWGYNVYGQLGNNANTSKKTPQKLNTIIGAASVSARYFHSAALMKDGSVYVWGDNTYSQVSLSDLKIISKPLHIAF